MLGIFGCWHTPSAEPHHASGDAKRVRAPARAASPRPRPAPVLRDLASVLRALPSELAQITDEEALGALGQRIARVPGVRSADLNRRGWTRTIMIDPMDAEAVAAMLGMGESFVVSPGVHQSTWMIVMRTGDEIVDSYGHRRVRAGILRAGEWSVRLAVDGRPPGPLPGRFWGPSPAYPLAGSRAKVTSISIDRWRP